MGCVYMVCGVCKSVRGANVAELSVDGVSVCVVYGDEVLNVWREWCAAVCTRARGRGALCHS